jgi:nucleotide-binding universal stress UspA family protein
MRDRLVAGFDGSDASVGAVTWAADEAVLRGATLEIVSSYQMTAPFDPAAASILAGTALDAIRAACEEELDRIADRVAAAHPTLEVERVATVDQPAHALVEATDRADLVVVGSSGHGAVQSLLLGSVAHALTRRGRCPIAIIRRQAGAVRRGTVVVGIDGSAAADRAVEWAVDEADRRGARLRVVHAWEPVYDEMTTGTAVLRDLAEVDAGCTLDRAVEHAVARGGCAVEPVLVKDLPWHALTDLSHDADLLVIGSRGRSEVRSLLFGSVAHAVTQTATCPVVVIPTAAC